MKYLSAYILLRLSGKDTITVSDMTNFFKKIDSQVDEEQIKAVISSLEGKCLDELAKNGLSKISNLTMTTAAAPAATSSSVPADKKEKKVEKAPVEEEVDMDMGDLFG